MEPRQRLADARRAASGCDGRVESSHIAAERLEVERGRCVEPLDRRAEVVDGERGVPGRERVPVQQREGLAGLELEIAECAAREVGVLGEVGLADGPERAHARCVAVVQGADVRQRDLGTGSLIAGGQRVRLAEERRAHDLGARRRAEPDEVAEDRRPVERRASSAPTPASRRIPTPVVTP